MRYVALIAATMVLIVSCSNSQAKPSTQPGSSRPRILEFDGENDVLRIAMVQPESADPADLVLTDQGQVILSDLLYDGLVEVEANSGSLRPGLATSWTSNDDFTEWTFDLDPERLTAEQVKSSFEHQGNQQSAVVRDLMSIVASVEVLSEFRLRFNLARSSAGFVWLTSGPGMAVAADDGETSSRLRIISEDTNGMILVSPDGMSDIDIRWTETEEDAFTLLESGEVNVAVGTSVSSSSGQVLGHVRFVAINSSSSILSEPTDRSLVRSIVQSADISNLELAGTVVGMEGLSSPALAGSASVLCEGSCGSVSADLSGRIAATGIELRLGVSSEADARAAEVVRDQFIEYNVAVEIVQSSPEELANKISQGEIDLLLFGWVAGASSVDSVVPSLIQSKSPGNIFQLQDGTIDGLLAEASKIGNDQDRWDLIAEAESLAISNDVVVPIGAIRSKVRTDGRTTPLVIRADGTLDTFRY